MGYYEYDDIRKLHKVKYPISIIPYRDSETQSVNFNFLPYCMHFNDFYVEFKDEHVLATGKVSEQMRKFFLEMTSSVMPATEGDLKDLEQTSPAGLILE